MDELIDCALKTILTVHKDIFGVKCTYVRFEPDDENYDWSSGFQSSSRFGRIVFQRADEKVQYSDRLALKVAPPRLFMKAFSPLQFYNEVFFYTRILPFFENSEMSRLFPRYYNSLLQYNAHTDDAVIVFENVQAQKYISARKKSYLDYHHLALMLRKLAEFHAYSYRARQEDPDQFYALTTNLLETNPTMLKQNMGLLSDTITRGLEPLLNDSRYSHNGEKLRKAFDEYEKLVKYTLTGDERNRVHVLCHGDFLRNNVLFKYDENGKPVDLKLVDMATCRFASPILDLATVLYLNADQRMRTENWDNLIDEYHTALRDACPESATPSKDSILAEFKSRALYAYLIASYFLPTLIEADRIDSTSLPDNHREESFVNFKETFYKDPSLGTLKESISKMGGEEATLGLTNILKDIIDRNFV